MHHHAGHCMLASIGVSLTSYALVCQSIWPSDNLLPVSASVSSFACQSISPPVRQSFPLENQFFNLPIYLPVRLSIHLPVSSSVRQSISLSIHESVNLLICLLVSLWVRQSVSLSVHESVSLSIRRAVSLSVRLSLCLLDCQSINASAHPTVVCQSACRSVR